MTVVIHIPSALRPYTSRQASVTVEATTVAQALARLGERFPALARHLYDEQGALRSFINVYLGEQDVRSLHNGATPLEEGAELSIVPAIAGGTV